MSKMPLLSLGRNHLTNERKWFDEWTQESSCIFLFNINTTNMVGESLSRQLIAFVIFSVLLFILLVFSWCRFDPTWMMDRLRLIWVVVEAITCCTKTIDEWGIWSRLLRRKNRSLNIRAHNERGSTPGGIWRKYLRDWKWNRVRNGRNKRTHRLKVPFV